MTGIAPALLVTLGALALLVAAGYHWNLVFTQHPQRELRAFIAWSALGAVALPLMVFADTADIGSAVLAGLLSPVIYGGIRLMILLRWERRYSAYEEHAQEMERLRFHHTDFGGPSATVAPAAEPQKAAAAVPPARLQVTTPRTLGDLVSDRRPKWRQRLLFGGACVVAAVGLAVFAFGILGPYDQRGADMTEVAYTAEYYGFEMVHVASASTLICPHISQRGYLWSAPGARGHACVRSGQAGFWIDETWTPGLGSDAATSPEERLASTVISDH